MKTRLEHFNVAAVDRPRISRDHVLDLTVIQQGLKPSA
jgi:hypothetical protein